MKISNREGLKKSRPGAVQYASRPCPCIILVMKTNVRPTTALETAFKMQINAITLIISNTQEDHAELHREEKKAARPIV